MDRVSVTVIMTTKERTRRFAGAARRRGWDARMRGLRVTVGAPVGDRDAVDELAGRYHGTVEAP